MTTPSLSSSTGHNPKDQKQAEPLQSDAGVVNLQVTQPLTAEQLAALKEDRAKRHRAAVRKWKEANPEKVKEHRQREYQNASPAQRAKIKARRIVNHAIKRGWLPRPDEVSCVDCGITAAEYHHENYSKPMDVVPLCKGCHLARHKSSPTLEPSNE